MPHQCTKCGKVYPDASQELLSGCNCGSKFFYYIRKEKFEELLEFFKKEGKFINEDYQVSYYFDCEEDLRIQKNNFGSKIWLKKGKIHDDAREEIEIKTDNFENLGKLFNNLGHNVEIKWLRDRKQFNWNEIKVCLDYTKGYGYIIELEKMSDEEGKEEVLNLLREKLKELNVEETSKEEFNKKFEYYKDNWEDLV